MGGNELLHVQTAAGRAVRFLARPEDQHFTGLSAVPALIFEYRHLAPPVIIVWMNTSRNIVYELMLIISDDAVLVKNGVSIIIKGQALYFITSIYPFSPSCTYQQQVQKRTCRQW